MTIWDTGQQFLTSSTNIPKTTQFPTNAGTDLQTLQAKMIKILRFRYADGFQQLSDYLHPKIEARARARDFNILKRTNGEFSFPISAFYDVKKRSFSYWNIKLENKFLKKYSATGNRTPVSRVTGGDTHHYTIVELRLARKIVNHIQHVQHQL